MSLSKIVSINDFVHTYSPAEITEIFSRRNNLVKSLFFSDLRHTFVIKAYKNTKSMKDDAVNKEKSMRSEDDTKVLDTRSVK